MVDCKFTWCKCSKGVFTSGTDKGLGLAKCSYVRISWIMNRQFQHYKHHPCVVTDQTMLYWIIGHRNGNLFVTAETWWWSTWWWSQHNMINHILTYFDFRILVKYKQSIQCCCITSVQSSNPGLRTFPDTAPLSLPLCFLIALLYYDRTLYVLS